MEVTFLKLQKNVEYNSQLPYSVVKSDDFDYRFTTKNGIIIVLILLMSLICTLLLLRPILST